MVQISTPGVTPNRGMGPPVRRFLSNYFDLLFSIAQTPTVRPRAHYIVTVLYHACVIRSSMHGWKEAFSVLGEREMSIEFFSIQSAAGSTLSVQQWKMLNPPFSGSSVARHSLRDCRSEDRGEVAATAVAGTSPWCNLVIVRVMPCGQEIMILARDINIQTYLLT